MLGIIIANWNGESIIDKCLQSLCNQTYKDFRLYIIDNNSIDNSSTIIESYMNRLNINFIKFEKNTGFAFANNVGINQAIDDGCNYILTLNNDVEIEENSLNLAFEEITRSSSVFDIYQLFMINFYDRTRCDAAGLRFDEKLFPIQVGYKKNINEILNESIEIDGVCAGAAIYSVKSLLDCRLENGDYFDSSFFAYYEDVDLSLRLLRKGYKFKLLKDSRVYHIHSATSNKTSGFKEYYLARNLFLYTKRNQDNYNFSKNLKYYWLKMLKQIVKGNFSIVIIKSTLRGMRDAYKMMKKNTYNFKG